MRVSALLSVVIVPPLVLSMVPPLMVRVPLVPRADALPRFNWPAARVTPPVKVFTPERVRVPAPALVSPKPLPKSVIAPLTVRVEAVPVLSIVHVWLAPRPTLAEMVLATVPAVLPRVMPPSMVSIFVPPMVTLPIWSEKARLLISKSASRTLVARFAAPGVVVAKVTFVPTPGAAPAAMLFVASVFQLPAALQLMLVAPLQKVAAGPAAAAATVTCSWVAVLLRTKVLPKAAAVAKAKLPGLLIAEPVTSV